MFVLLFGLLSPLAMAEPLDLDSGTQIAAEQSNLAATAALAVRQQQIDLQQARVAWTPDLQVGVGSQVSLGRTFSEQLGVNVTEPNTSLYSSLTTSMPLYQGGQLRADRAQADAQLRASESARAQALYDLRWWVADGLLQIAQAQSAVSVQNTALQADQALLEQVEVQVEAGARTEADRHAQQAVVSSRQASLASAEQALAEAELTLLTTLRLNPDDDWLFVPPPSLGEADDIQALLAQATQLRPDLRAAEQTIEAASSQERSARGSALPAVGLGAGASTTWLSSNPEAFADQLDSQARTWASVDVTFRLFDRGVRRASVATAQVGVRSAELAQQSLSDEVGLGLRRLLTQQAEAEAYLVASTAAATASAQAVEVLTLRYESGAETLVSVTQARADLVDAELQRVQAQFAVQRVRYQLAWTSGELGAG